ncbi:hypothetical protein B0I35DRAFT_109782 [Stachybotrys elegans]|uniref:Mid2 domain-containing protein n=1 Tax=Stachybotrys elegans TaxID=80388 RepID=A0A8K0SBS0_9HYPO|nr:hypothetical protein B0I35DRAFT_109782 [Stachybotrys elegans]
MSGCYDMNNNESLDYWPCDPEGELKSCCPRGSVCASNGLCRTTGNDTFTDWFAQGCRVDNWDDPSCASQCLNSGGDGVTICGDGRFCCYGLGGCDCDDPERAFTTDPIRLVASIFSDASRVGDVSIFTTATDATTSSTITSVPAITTSDPATTTSATTTSSLPTDSLNQDPSTEESSDNSLAVGLGVGLGVGIPLIAIGAGLFWFFKKRKSPSNYQAAPQEQHSPKHVYAGAMPPKPEPYNGAELYAGGIPLQPGSYNGAELHGNASSRHELA